MDFKPRTIGKGKGQVNRPRNHYHPGFSAPSTASTSQVKLDSPSTSSATPSATSREFDPELAAKKEAQAAIKAASAAKRAAENERLAARADAEAIGLLELSLSDWAVDHAGTGLRMKLKSAERGFISLNWFMRKSTVLGNLPDSHKQPTALLKALKMCPSDLVELRMSLAEGSTFEIRRKTPLTSERAEESELLERTVYAENLSPRANTLPGLLSSLRDLFPSATSRHSVQAIENLHAANNANEHEKDKKKLTKLEHVRVVLATREEAEMLAREWSWRPAVLYGNLVEDEALRTAAEEGDWRARSKREAQLVGFRTLLWSEFEKRREEYLAYQRRMMPAAPPPPTAALAAASASAQSRADSTWGPLATSSRSHAQYPEGCLVFIKNVPTDTNKTALKETFNELLDGETVDYVDWEKGLDTCHVRTSTPDKASKIQGICSSKPVLLLSSGPTSALSAEVVTGTREEIYWMALPPKIRESSMRALDGVVDEPASKRRKRA